MIAPSSRGRVAPCRGAWRITNPAIDLKLFFVALVDESASAAERMIILTESIGVHTDYCSDKLRRIQSAYPECERTHRSKESWRQGDQITGMLAVVLGHERGTGLARVPPLPLP